MLDRLSHSDKFLKESTRKDGEDKSGQARPHTGQDLTLELRYKDGRIDAFPYAYMSAARYDPAIGITVYCAGWRIVIKGSALTPLMRDISMHKRDFVEEYSSPAITLAEGEKRPHVEKIEVTEPGGAEKDDRNAKDTDR
jgi:hypothetical protein